MAKIYKRSDRITVKIGELTVKLAPLTLHQKTEAQIAVLKGHKSADIREATRGMALAMRYSLRTIEGLEDSDGKPYKLQFDSNDELTDECIDDLMNIELTPKLALVCLSMVNGIPTEFTDSERKVMEGVELVKTEKADPEKKN